MEIVIRKVDRYGWIPIVKDPDGYEVYRGEFKHTPTDAFDNCNWWIENKLDSDGYSLDI